MLLALNAFINFFLATMIYIGSMRSGKETRTGPILIFILILVGAADVFSLL